MKKKRAGAQRNEKLACMIISMFDEVWGERSSKARCLAEDIASAAASTKNKEVEKVFLAVHDAFDFGHDA